MTSWMSTAVRHEGGGAGAAQSPRQLTSDRLLRGVQRADGIETEKLLFRVGDIVALVAVVGDEDRPLAQPLLEVVHSRKLFLHSQMVLLEEKDHARGHRSCLARALLRGFTTVVLDARGAHDGARREQVRLQLERGGILEPLR